MICRLKKTWPKLQCVLFFELISVCILLRLDYVLVRFPEVRHRKQNKDISLTYIWTDLKTLHHQAVFCLSVCLSNFLSVCHIPTLHDLFRQRRSLVKPPEIDQYKECFNNFGPPRCSGGYSVWARGVNMAAYLLCLIPPLSAPSVPTCYKSAPLQEHDFFRITILCMLHV